jgi:hypothetical protein
MKTFLVQILIVSLFFLYSVCCSAQVPVADSIVVVKQQPQWKKLLMPGAFITAGAFFSGANKGVDKTVRDWRNRHYPNFNSKLDDYLQYAPAPLVFIMDAMGAEARNNWQQQGWLLVKAELLMLLTVEPVKRLTAKVRPNGSSYRSFPSGHTAQAFVAAHFFNKEYGHKYPWLSAGMYSIAATTAVLRVLKDRHWITDVVAAAGFGMLCTEISYLTQCRSKKNHLAKNMLLMPSYQNGNMAITMLYKL